MAKSTAYHHGNLRQALLRAARELATEQSIDNLTLREVARRAGVSHAAPYHHFADKRALSRALALEAFKDLTSQMHAQQNSKLEQRLKNIGLVYVRFALHHPTEFRFMFRKSLCEPPGTPDELTETANQGFEMLIDTIRQMQQIDLIQAGDPKNLALVAWSAIHGLASLLVEAPIVPEPITEEVLEQLSDLVSQTLQQGLFKRA